MRLQNFDRQRCVYGVVGAPGVDAETLARRLATELRGLPLAENLLPLVEAPVIALPPDLLVPAPIDEVPVRPMWWHRAYRLVGEVPETRPVVFANPVRVEGDLVELWHMATHFTLHLQVMWIDPEFPGTLASLGSPLDEAVRWRYYRGTVRPQLNRPPLSMIVHRIVPSPGAGADALFTSVCAALELE